MLWFTGARIVWGGRTLKTLEEGHRILTERALNAFAGALPPGASVERIQLGNHRADLPRLRADWTITLWGLADALWRAQLLPKFAHGMRQLWFHPVTTLPRVQMEIYRRLSRACTLTDIGAASEALGAALHTIQDTYTPSHTRRKDNRDPFSPLVRLYYSPSRTHPFISPLDRVWEDESAGRLTPEAEAAIIASIAALRVWSEGWQNPAAGALIAEFVQTYAPIEHGGRPFQPES